MNCTIKLIDTKFDRIIEFKSAKFYFNENLT